MIRDACRLTALLAYMLSVAAAFAAPQLPEAGPPAAPEFNGPMHHFDQR